jgi:hypothetical protein
MSEIREVHNDQPGENRLFPGYWPAHFRDKKNSGLSQAEYCRRHGIKYNAFQYWKQKVCKPKSSSSMTFVQVRDGAAAVELDSAGTELNFKSPLIQPSCPQLPPPYPIKFWVGGFCIEVGNNFSPTCLVELIRTLVTLGKVGKVGKVGPSGPLGSR